VYFYAIFYNTLKDIDMKPIKTIFTALFLSLTLSLASRAESPSSPAASDDPMTMEKGMGMSRGMGMKGGNMTEAERDQHMRMYQEHMLKMHDLSNRILAEPDEKKKEQLKNEQLELMKSHHAQMKTHRMEKMQKHRKTETPATKTTP
jgi:Spy/CpxP family protein refolding chaperone